jgi:hypothetical protein
MTFYQVKRSIEANDKDFKLKQLETEFFKDQDDAVDCLIEWTKKYSTEIVTMQYIGIEV